MVKLFRTPKYTGVQVYIGQDISKKYGGGSKYVATLWFELFDNPTELQKFALSFSHDMNIVESDQWLNLKPENGLDGFVPGVKRTPEHQANLTKAISGKPLSEEHKTKLRGPRHPCSEERKRKISESNLGRKVSEAGRKNMRKPKVLRERICPYCGYIGKGANMSRYHFENCSEENIRKRKLKEFKRNNPVNQNFKECPHCGLIGSGPNMSRYHFNNCKLISNTISVDLTSQK